jgi:hypothetical protein
MTKKSGMPKMKGIKALNPFGKTKQVAAMKKSSGFMCGGKVKKK